MSIKIYEGFSIAPSHASLAAIHMLAGRLQNKYREIAEDHLTRYMIEMALYEFDRRSLGLPPINPDRSPIFAIRQDIFKDQNERKDPCFLDFRLVLFPHPDGRVLGLCNTWRQEWRDAFLAEDGIVDYGYWDNTDKPEDVTDAQWQKRAEDWSLCLLSNRFYTDGGIKITIVDAYNVDPKSGFLQDPELSAYLPSMEKRAGLLARDMLMARKNPTSTRESMKIFNDMREGAPLHAEFEALRAELQQYLDPAPDFHKLAETKTPVLMNILAAA